MEMAEREAMILQWLPLAWRSCRRFRRCGILLDDLRQEAVVGLISAVDMFDSVKGPFMAYASKTINHHLTDMCANQMRPWRVPNYLNNRIRKVRKAVMDLALKGIYDPSPLLLSEQSGLSLKMVATALSVERMRVPSDDFPMAEEPEPIDVAELMSPLNLDQQNLLIQRYGLYGQPVMRLNDVAAVEGVTKECIRKRQDKALALARWRAQA